MTSVLVVILVIVLAVLAFIVTRPAKFRVERSTIVSAPPGEIFSLVNDFHQWNRWSPWEKLDPNLQRSFTGASSGAGAGYGWVGNRRVGEGRMTIVQADPPSRIDIKLEFIKPFAATNTTIFTLAPVDAGTRVTWAMEGENTSFMSKAFAAFGNMDKFIGKDFEKGLANMKAEAEK